MDAETTLDDRPGFWQRVRCWIKHGTQPPSLVWAWEIEDVAPGVHRRELLYVRCDECEVPRPDWTKINCGWCGSLIPVKREPWWR